MAYGTTLRQRFAKIARANRGFALVAIASFAILVLPDLVFHLAGYQTSAIVKRETLLLAALLALALTAIRSARWRHAAIAAIVLSQALWLGCLAYFGRPLGPEQMLLAFHEARDVTAGIFDGWRVLLPALASAGLSGILLLAAQKREMGPAPLRQLAGGWILAIFLIALCAYWLTHRRVVVTIPGAHTLAALGPYQTAVSAARLLMTPVKAAPGMSISDQIVSPAPLEEEPVTVAVIMGEGISPLRLSLFGFERETTPRLAAWRTAPPEGFEMIARIGISGGVSTFGSVPAFLKMSYWPVASEWRGVSLYDLAHKSGFKSWFLSAQSRHFLDVAGGARGAEQVIAEQDIARRLEAQHDDVLIELVREIPLGAKRRFVFIHQRTNHSNYTSHCSHLAPAEQKAVYTITPRDNSREELRRAAYDNGTRCWDRNVDGLARLLAEAPGAVHILVTADHGEMMGEFGLWGHSQPDLRVAQVPVVLLTNRPQSDVAQRFRALSPPSWYALSQLVARALGHDVSTPGARADRIYLNATMPFGRSGYFEADSAGSGRFKVRRYSREGQKQDETEFHMPEMGRANDGSALPPPRRGEG